MPRDSGEWNRAQKVKGRGPFTPTEALFTAFFFLESQNRFERPRESPTFYLAFRDSLCVLELSMTPYNNVGMRSLSRSDHRVVSGSYQLSEQCYRLKGKEEKLEPITRSRRAWGSKVRPTALQVWPSTQGRRVIMKLAVSADGGNGGGGTMPSPVQRASFGGGERAAA